MRSTSRLTLAFLAFASSAHCEESKRLPWLLGMNDVTPIEVPAPLRAKVGLEYGDSDPIKGVHVDLNGDGIKDYLIQSARSLCGNGGCVYAIFDGATGKELGQVFGSPVYAHAEKAHGYPIIDGY